MDKDTERLLDWLDERPDSPGKRLAEESARIWETEGESVAVAYLVRELKAIKAVYWEALAVADMTTAYRYKLREGTMC